MADMQESRVYVPFLDQLADAASSAILPHFRALSDITDKGTDRFDPVTIADRDGERAMRDLIGQTYPEHGIYGEEFGLHNESADNVWILDPIDGTRAFIAGLPTWGTLIGLRSSGHAVLGMMCQPFTAERYAGDGSQAWYRGPEGSAQLTTRACPDLARATMLTTSPHLFSAEQMGCYQAVERAVRLTRYGTDCYGYCMVAAGHADIVVEAGLNPYDIVALIPIIEGAGGTVTNWTGGSAVDGGCVLATGDRATHDKVLKMLNP
jgi:histidinol phosphatase-like enzyme (inositol monophosphatase family)